ncbi:hypothetical protein PENTCL1PPCAC_1361 [Pristionchus entomophagus]|uniref:Uncharacterized protein n=1 Tax=Pristionchus entomophagus TaxID=358040 RepID=A0AAV5S8A1_9BILA|nr:hypothetical protein PENTCL1PPCAC_1361 [Pristionchus entomophagus]
MCKGGKKTKEREKKGVEKEKEPKTLKTEPDDDSRKEAKDAARIAAFKAKLEAKSPPTVYRPDVSSECALAKIPEICPSSGPK